MYAKYTTGPAAPRALYSRFWNGLRAEPELETGLTINLIMPIYSPLVDILLISDQKNLPKPEVPMPIYEYKCGQCGQEFEELVFSEDETPACPKCGSAETNKLMSCCRHKSGGAVGGGETEVADTSSTSSTSSSACSGCSGGSCSTCGI